MNEQPSSSRARTVAIGLSLIAYFALSIYSHGASAPKALGAALSIGPLLIVLLVVLWRSLSRPLAFLASALTAALVVAGWGAFERHYEWSDLLQQVLIYALIAVMFGRSLRAGQLPLLTQLAEKTHGPLESAERTYLKGATAAWTIFYALTALLILVLFFVASPRVWSIFTDVLVFVAIALMVLIEHAVRRVKLRRKPAGGLARALRQALIG